MKTLDVALIPTNLNKFLFKDDYYNYSLRGKEKRKKILSD